MDDLAKRLANRGQLSTDGHSDYIRAVKGAFCTNVDYAQLVKLYGEPAEKGPERKYSPSICLGVRKMRVEAINI